MIPFKFLLLISCCETFLVHCSGGVKKNFFDEEPAESEHTPFDSFWRKGNQFGLREPILRIGKARDADNVKPREIPFSETVNVQIELKPLKMDHLIESFRNQIEPEKKIPIIQYIAFRLSYEPIYHFRLSQFTDSREGHANELYYVLYDVKSNEVSQSDVPAYFAPQHKSIRIPIHPNENEPRLVFTQPLSGCSLAVDRFDTHFQVYHVNGGQEDEQYHKRRDGDGNLVDRDHGYGLAGVLESTDYGYIKTKPNEDHDYTMNTFGFAFMEYSNGGWHIHHQKLHAPSGMPSIKGIFNNGFFFRTKIVDVWLPENVVKVAGLDTFPVSTSLQMPPATRQAFVREYVQNEIQKIRQNLMNCAHPRRKRETSHCYFSNVDLKQFASDWSDPEKIQINSDMFINFLKHNPNKNMNEQLLRFVAGEKIISNMKGDYVADVKKMIEYGDPKSFKIDQRMHTLIGDTYRENKINRVKFTEKFPKYSNRLMLVHSLYGLKHSCADEKNAVSCGIGVGALTWSYASHPIENYLYKKAVPKVANKIITASYFLRHIAPNSQAISKLFAKTFSKTIVKGSIGILGSAFDVYDVIVSVTTLRDCNKRKTGDKPCSDKTIRDSIASLVFDGISIAAGVTLISFPVIGLAMTLITFAAQIVYNGVSAVLEYKKYDTDTLEDISIFLASVRFGKAKISESLDKRQQLVNERAESARDLLNSQSENSSIIAYGIGLGYYGQSHESIPSYSDIFLENENDKFSKVSRVQPTPLDNMEMICLPSNTGEFFENGKLKNVASAKYFCNNALVLRHKQRKGDTVIINLELVRDGHIMGSNNWNNNFIIYNSTNNLFISGGQNVRNTFTINDPTTKAIIRGGKNSLNIFDYRNARTSSKATLFMGCTENQFILNSNDNLAEVTDNFSDKSDSRSYQYIGSSYVVDKISCFRTNCNKSVVIHTGGGNETDYDEIYDCGTVILSPFTTFTEFNSESDTNDKVIYVQTNGYNGQNLESKIVANHSKINVIFNEFNLIDDTDMIYRPKEKELVINLYFKDSRYKVTLSPYGNDNSFILINKYKHYIIPKILHSDELNDVLLDTIIRHVKCSKESNYNVMSDRPDICTDEVIAYGNSEDNRNTLKILTILNMEPVGNLIIGSNSNDLIVLNQELRFASGQGGTDTYYLDFGLDAIIYNFAEDKMLDVIVMPNVPTTYTVDGENMHLKSNGTHITILNFFNSSDYQHIYFTDSNQMRSFIPLKTNHKIIPFIHATPSQRVFVIEKLSDYPELVIDAKRRDLRLYKHKKNLLIMRNDTNQLVIEIKNYFIDAKEDQVTDWLLYNNSNEFESFTIEDAPIGNYEDLIKADYTDYFEEFEVKFDKNELLRRNQLNTERERIGLLIIDNVLPNTIEVLQKDKSLLLFDKLSKFNVEIQNWDESVSNRITNIEFTKQIRPITIFGIDRFNLNEIEKIQALINAAAQNVNLLNKFTSQTEVGVKCLVTINGLIEEYPTYQCIGMDSIDEQRLFFEKNCNTEKLNALNIKTSLKELDAVAFKLRNDLQLNAYDRNMTYFCSDTINTVITEYSKEYVESYLHKNLSYISASRDSLHRTPLHLVVVAGNFEMVEYVVTQFNDDINAADSEGKTPLYYTLKEVQKNCKYQHFTDCKETERTKGLLRIAEYLCSRSATFDNSEEISETVENMKNSLEERDYRKLFEKLESLEDA